MIVEVGMPWDDATNSYATINDLLNKMNYIPNSKGLGVFYWEPESYSVITSYSIHYTKLYDGGLRRLHLTDTSW